MTASLALGTRDATRRTTSGLVGWFHRCLLLPRFALSVISRLLLLLAAVASVGGCSRGGGEIIDVYAASSLGEVAEELADGFEARNPGVSVRVTLAGTQHLRAQIELGADAEVLLSAGALHVDALAEAGFATNRTTVACNTLALLAPADSDLSDVEGLSRAIYVVVGAPDVPLGQYTAELLERGTGAYGRDWRAQVDASIRSEELSASAVAAKIILGEADAAIVYRTDALRAGDAARYVEIPPELDVSVRYEAVRIGPPSLFVDRWLAEIESERGREAFGRFGFTPCDPSGDGPRPEGSGGPTGGHGAAGGGEGSGVGHHAGRRGRPDSRGTNR